MAEVQTIDYISGFIAKNKSRIKKVMIGATSHTSISVVMNDDTDDRCFNIGTGVPMYYGNSCRRRYTWIDILIIYLRCDMKPPKICVRITGRGDPVYVTSLKRQPLEFLRDLEFEEYSPELSQLLLDFIMGDPEHIIDVLKKGSGSIECIKVIFYSRAFPEYDPLNGEIVERRHKVDPSFTRDLVSEIHLDELAGQLTELFVSDLVEFRDSFINDKLEELIKSEELSPEQKMFFVRYYREHYGSEEKEVLHL
jgi:hypothetical protein